MSHPRIESRPGKMGGKPCIKGTRITVWNVLSFIEDGYLPADICASVYPDLTVEDVDAAVRFAAEFPEGGDNPMSTDWRNDPEWLRYVATINDDDQSCAYDDGEAAVEAYKRTLKTRIEELREWAAGNWDNKEGWEDAIDRVLAVLEES